MPEAVLAVEPQAPENPFEIPEGLSPVKFEKFTLNVHKNKILFNVKRNIRRHLPQLDCYAPTTKPVAIVAGGWSLEPTLPELLEHYYKGHPVVALNGAANWLMERNIRPAMQIILDSREENLEFVERPIPRCRYFLASQCHPSLFDACAGRDVWIWHALSCGEGSREQEILDQYYLKKWRHVPAGGTVGLRAPTLVRILGYQLIEVFGLDSCLSPDGQHHAYKQDWNESDRRLVPIWVAGKEFVCAKWHAAQFEQFKDYFRTHVKDMHLNVHGDGMIAHLLRAGVEAGRSQAGAR